MGKERNSELEDRPVRNTLRKLEEKHNRHNTKMMQKYSRQ